MGATGDGEYIIRHLAPAAVVWPLKMVHRANLRKCSEPTWTDHTFLFFGGASYLYIFILDHLRWNFYNFKQIL